MNNLRPLVAVACLALALACSGAKQAAPSGPPPDAKRVDASKAGSVAGRALLDGPAPANAPIRMSSDPFCIREHPEGASSESVVVENGGLENVFVYVKDGLGQYYFDVPTTPVKLDQRGCRYLPHVLGVRAGQPLEITNSDAIMHNVHALSDVNQPFNYGQPLKGMSNTRTFTAREVMVPFTCDVHNWMHAYVGVLDHPYFAVTQDGGKFELKNLPAGTYTVEAWHEKLATRTQSVTLGEKESKDVTFTFKAPAATGN